MLLWSLKMSAAKWRYRFSPKAQKQVQKLSQKDSARVFDSINELINSDNPTFMAGVKLLKGSSDPRKSDHF
jgi:mRNA-degrading endonuclease RelE of RelBE toxin-antitoxin system